MDNLECLERWVTNVDQSHIFCERNVTTYFDGDYNFTLWPKEPTPNCTAQKIYHSHGVWNGITVSKINKDNVELYWFTKKQVEDGWHKWFIRNKPLLVKCIAHFNKYKYILDGDNRHFRQKSLSFMQNFEVYLPVSESMMEESHYIANYINSVDLDPFIADNIQKQTNLSKREIEVLAIIGRGYTYKIVADKLNLTPKTALHYIEHIKQKTGLHSKFELMQLYESYFF